MNTHVPNVPEIVVGVLCPVYSTIGTYDSTSPTDHVVLSYEPTQYDWETLDLVSLFVETNQDEDTHNNLPVSAT